jgi:predicted nucleic acid-binding protein
LLAKRLDLPESDLYREYQLLPIIACQPDRYELALAEANRLIGDRDPKDVPILALAMSLRCALWTDDRDFDGLPGVSIVRTADLVTV